MNEKSISIDVMEYPDAVVNILCDKMNSEF